MKKNISVITENVSKNNYVAFVWHGIFLSLASNFMDVHTIIPAMLLKAGASSIQLGLATTIMIGGSSLMQIFFARSLSNKNHKKSPLLFAINLRVLTLFMLSFLLLKSGIFPNCLLIIIIFIIITIFSFSGSYASISYIDIIGKSILNNRRKDFFSFKQIIGSIGLFLSALLVRHLLRIYTYPTNYSVLFFGAGFFLFFASLGFWKIKEVIVPVSKRLGFKSFLKMVPLEILKNKNLKNYLLTINTLGLTMSFIPFMVLFAKHNFGLNNKMIGNILFWKILGMLLTSIILYKKSKTFEYKRLLRISLLLGFSLPILALVFKGNYFLYQLLFFVAGVLLTSFNVARNGVLVEISNNENRAIYTGISGAGSILPTIFPLISGIFITIFGYETTFIILSVIIGMGLFFINGLDCKIDDEDKNEN
jgi:MFS family permease